MTVTIGLSYRDSPSEKSCKVMALRSIGGDAPLRSVKPHSFLTLLVAL
jgi:hypothetical protein